MIPTPDATEQKKNNVLFLFQSQEGVAGQFKTCRENQRSILDLSGCDITTSLAAWLKSGGDCGASRTATPFREISQFKDGWLRWRWRWRIAQDRDGTGKIIGHEGATAITKEHALGLWCAQRATDEGKHGVSVFMGRSSAMRVNMRRRAKAASPEIGLPQSAPGRTH
jgi:hypothetical protein